VRSFIGRVKRVLGEVVVFVVVVGMLAVIVGGLYWLTQRQWGGNPNTDDAGRVVVASAFR
jgi:hypothetical protein